jgi:hypothetical protein
MLDDLKRSGLTSSDATKLGLKPLTAQQSYNAVGKKLIGYSIPYFDINGKKVKHQRVRFLEKEKRLGKEVDTQKYSQAKDSPVRLYFPPLIDWKAIAADANAELYFTEGEKKAAKACKEGLPCIGLGGVWAFKSKKEGKSLIDDFNDFNWRERPVSLVFDSDLKTNPKVMQALVAFSNELTKVGATVYIAYLPSKGDEKVGLDDYLLKHTADDVRELDYEEYRLSKELWRLNNEIALIENIASFRVFKNSTIQNKESIKTLFEDREIERETDKGIKKVSVITEWFKWPLRRRHTKLEYAPGQSPVLDDGSLNTWEGWGTKPEDGSIKAFYTLLEHIIPDEEFRMWFLQWMAYPIQNPGTKLFTSVLLHGRNHGTGKTFIGYMIGQIYGVNYQELSQEDIHNPFNSWAVDKQFIVGEEITGSDKRRDADKLKSMITRETLTVNEKNVRQYTIKDCINYFFTSNHPDAFFLEDQDRRFAIYETEAEPMDDEEYAKIDSWYKSGGTSHLFYHLLNDIDCSTFNPKARAPLTAAKRDMIELSRSDLDNFTYDLKNDADNILVHMGVKIDRDLYTAEELVHIYDPEGSKRTSLIAMSKSLKRAGFKQYHTNTKGGHKKLWACRDWAYWASADHGERVKDYDDSVIGHRNKKVIDARQKFKGREVGNGQ